MNKLLIFFYAVVSLSYTYARPDVSLGYRYNQGHSTEGVSFLQAPVVTSYGPTAASNSYFSSQPAIGQIVSSSFSSYPHFSKQENFGGYEEQTTNLGSGYSGNVASFGGIGTSSQTGFGPLLQTQGDFQQISPIVSKHFYVHTAPSDDDEEEIVRHIQVGQPQKNYRVVFINAPSSHSTKAKIIADIAPTEEKTAIYVLAKKNNALDISAEVNTPSPVNNKPEVFFVKYKTPEEAVHAQHTIQAQYDALGGTSDISNEGQIPVSSVVGSLHTSPGGSEISTSASVKDGSVELQHTGINTQQTYLPPNRKFKYKY